MSLFINNYYLYSSTSFPNHPSSSPTPPLPSTTIIVMKSALLHFIVFIILSTLLLTTTVQAHGVPVYPYFRGTLKTNSIFRLEPRNPLLRRFKPPHYDDLDIPDCECPHCANGGGKGGVMKAAKGKWTPYEPTNPKLPFRRDHGMCGDPISDTAPRDHEAGGKWGYPKSPITANYKTGQIVEFVVDVTTNHNGWFDFFICDATKCGGDISEKCFKDGHCHTLMREKTPACESEKSKECAPVDEKYPGRWYIPCRRGDHVGEHFMGGPFMRYKLPPGFKSEHAVIQFYWVTANSCNPPGFIDYFKRYPMKVWGKCPGDGGSLGGRNPTLGECGGPSFPEEFWGCADVSVGGTGKVKAAGSLPPVPKGKPVVKRTPPPEPKPTEEETKPEAKPMEEAKPEAKPMEEPKPEPKPTEQPKPEPKPVEEPKPTEQPKHDDDDHKDRPKELETRKSEAKPAAPTHANTKETKQEPANNASNVKEQHPKDNTHMAFRKKTMKQREETLKKREMTTKEREMTMKAREQTEQERRNTNAEQRRKTEKEREMVSSQRGGTKGSCQTEFEQCGGKYYKGPTECCDKRYECRRRNQYYSQCSLRR